MTEDFWKPAIKVMCDSKLADTLNAVDPNDVPVRTLRLLEEKIFHREDADAAKIRNFSVAAEGEKRADRPRHARPVGGTTSLTWVTPALRLPRASFVARDLDSAAGGLRASNSERAIRRSCRLIFS